MSKKRRKRSDATPTPPQERTQVLYDGECAMCSTLALRINSTQAKASLATNDLHQASLPDGVSADAVRHELHVIDPDGTVRRGPDAVFRILEEYPRWRGLARIARWSPFRPLMQLGYRFFAANREHIFGPTARLFWSKIAVTSALLGGLAMSPKLWVSERAYPILPALARLPAALEYLALGTLVAAAIVAALAPRPRGALSALVVAAVLLASGDYTRWQPWFYQYVVMLGVLAGWNWDGRDLKGSLEPLAALRVVIVGTYVWSGIQKLNASYLGGTFGWLVEPLAWILPSSIVDALSTLGMATPVLEIAIGVGLLIPATRAWAVVAATGMHALILMMLGPWAHNSNSVVWPWNVAMIALVLILFRGDNNSMASTILGRPRSLSRAVASLLFLVLPALSLIDKWDPYLSLSLYSRNLPHAGLRLRPDARLALPAAWQPYADERDVMWPMTWAFDELNVPAYPAERSYKALARAVCNELPDPTGLILGLSSKPDPFTGEFSVTDYTCDEL
jgi:predicted DCC family thiol-disulfide oxidoreductase YuxK